MLGRYRDDIGEEEGRWWAGIGEVGVVEGRWCGGRGVTERMWWGYQRGQRTQRGEHKAERGTEKGGEVL